MKNFLALLFSALVCYFALSIIIPAYFQWAWEFTKKSYNLEMNANDVIPFKWIVIVLTIIIVGITYGLSYVVNRKK